MKIRSIVLAVAFSAALFSGCSMRPAARLGNHESQFASRLEYLRFCQQYDPLARHCD